MLGKVAEETRFFYYKKLQTPSRYQSAGFIVRELQKRLLAKRVYRRRRTLFVKNPVIGWIEQKGFAEPVDKAMRKLGL